MTDIVLERSGVLYCLEHCGVANEDVISKCDFADNEPEECRFVDLYFIREQR